MLISRRDIAVEWGDCDAAGIVYFPRYFEWFDACTTGLFRHAGYEKKTLLDAFGIVGLPAVQARARFIQPSTFGDTVTVETTITRFGRSSFDLEHRLFKGAGAAGQVLAVEGFETRVWTARTASGLEGIPVPAEVVARLSAG